MHINTSSILSDPSLSASTASAADYTDALQTLSETTRAYWVSANEPIQYKDSPSALDLMRAVSDYKPCIFRGLITHWKALNWSLESLQESCASKLINVNFTPHGRADAIHFDPMSRLKYFTTPSEIQVPFALFKQMLQHPQPHDAVPYLSSQNDNLRQSFPHLLHDIDPSIHVADEVFGKDKLEAINLWIGDERSVTSIHKDHYENLYCVVKGEAY
jgi:peptidyl-lysine (3S)-dioxygenase / protease